MDRTGELLAAELGGLYLLVAGRKREDLPKEYLCLDGEQFKALIFPLFTLKLVKSR